MGERLGQHFLASNRLANRLVNLMEQDPKRAVLELGAGNGIFTAELADRFKKVVALELDERLLLDTRSKLANHGNISWILSDMMEVEPSGMIEPHSILAANLPYQIAGPMLARIATWSATFDFAYLMLQREVAERLVAPIHNRQRSRLTVLMEVFCPAQILLKLSPGAFRPPPKVESAFVKLAFTLPPPAVDKSNLEELLRVVFSTRRKKICTAVATWAHRDKQEIGEMMQELDVDPQGRAEDLSSVDWLKLLSLKQIA